MADLSTQKAEVDQAIAPLVADLAREEASLNAAPGDEKDQYDTRFDKLLGDHRRAESQVLKRLSERGNAEAMFRLADTLRESDDASDVRQWFELTIAASRLGHAGSDDELVRWYWHQRGGGTIAEIQSNRAVAFHYAEKAAGEGDFNAIHRIAVYISGGGHQYPGDLTLARRVLELCARADAPWCQETLVIESGYDYAVPRAQAHLWLSRLAAREPSRFSQLRDSLWSKMTSAQQVQAERAKAEWWPSTWLKLRPEWKQLEADILAHGSSSAGPDTSCTTSTPWCRGHWLANKAGS